MRARILAMDERNPRSKLPYMKRRYFIATMTVFLGIFLLAYLMLEILFMIFEAEPYTKLLVLFVLFVTDFVATDHIINQVYKDRWLREAPDILDAIKTPEPAYIPEGPSDAKSDTAGTKDNKEVRRFHRTQYKELEKQAQKEKQETESMKKDADASLPETREELSSSSAKERKKRVWFRKEKKDVPAAEETKPVAADAAKMKWTPDLDDMDTVEFEEAVMSLEQRVRKAETKQKDSEFSESTVKGNRSCRNRK